MLLFTWVPCQSRLEFVLPKKNRKAKKQMIKQQKKTTKEYIACKISFFTIFWTHWSRGNSGEFFLIHFPSLMDAVSLWFVWVRFGSRKVNEPEIGSVSVCIPTVCFVESKLMDAVWPPYAILIAMGMGSTPRSEVQR